MRKKPNKLPEIEIDDSYGRLASDIMRFVKGYRRETKKEKRLKKPHLRD